MLFTLHVCMRVNEYEDIVHLLRIRGLRRLRIDRRTKGTNAW
jgi:hypothetical protein